MIDRDEVLHVARLARLALSEEEIEPMARELSAVLDHVAKIGELDLDGVAPTSHVVEVTGALRADEPRPCLPREVALAPGARRRRRRLPRPEPAGMSDVARRCPPRRPPSAIAAGELSAGELFDAYRARAAADRAAGERG